MNNQDFLSFERSRYMPGRYVSALDLSRDQDYQNNKRRLVNRLLHGCGVVCGLGVLCPDEYTVAIESGCALDYAGREIVVPQSHTRKLRQLDGYDPSGGPDAYLCLEYAKELDDPVQVISTSNEAPQFSSSRDSFRLYLDYSPPPADVCLHKNELVLYDGNGVRVTQSVPSFVRPGEAFEVTVKVEKRGQPLPVTLTYDMELLYCTHGDRSFCRVHIENAGVSQTYTLKAGTASGADGRIRIGNVTFNIGERAFPLNGAEGQSFRVAEGDLRQSVFERYLERNLERLLEESAGIPICLAKLSLIRAGDASVIGGAEPLPFGQKLLNNQLLTAFLQMNGAPAAPAEEKQKTVNLPHGGADCKTGRVSVKMPGGGENGKVYFSPEVAHGLGPGYVYVQTAFLAGDGETAALHGDTMFRIFPASPPRCAVAVRNENGKGTFVIGVRMLENTEREELSFSWMALRDSAESSAGFAEKGIYILPDVINLRTRESRRLEAFVTGLPDKGCVFHVKDENGGTVDYEGNYTAPAIPGVYEVAAVSTYDETVRNSVFIVVRERTL